MRDYLLNSFIPNMVSIIIALGVVFGISWLSGVSEDEIVGWVALGIAASAGASR
jgi:hypothetical protein